MEGMVSVQAGPSAPGGPSSLPPHPRVGPVLPTEVSVWSRVGFPTQRGPGGPRLAILSPHTAGALPFTHPEREEKARPRVLGRVSVVVEGDLSAADGHRAAVADPRHGTTADSEGPGAVSVWHVPPQLPVGDSTSLGKGEGLGSEVGPGGDKPMWDRQSDGWC